LEPVTRARELRRDLTPAEQVLWKLLRDRRLLGVKFRRQCPINRYIADFCCRELRLVVELDGGVHLEEMQIEHDLNRDGYLQSLGYTVLRFPNQAVQESPSEVLAEVTRTIRSLRPNLFVPTSPSPGGAGEGAGG
jgi:type I restriction enzyme R subunit